MGVYGPGIGSSLYVSLRMDMELLLAYQTPRVWLLLFPESLTHGYQMNSWRTWSLGP